MSRAARAAEKIAYLVVVRQWWWMALLALATAIVFFATGHRWWALGWAAGYGLYAWLTLKLWRIDRNIQRRYAHAKR